MGASNNVNLPEQDIMIADAEFYAEAARAADDAKAAEEVLAQLSFNLNELTSAIEKGEVANIFKEYAAVVEGMKEKLSELVQEEQRLITQMIGDIDEADSFIY